MTNRISNELTTCSLQETGQVILTIASTSNSNTSIPIPLNVNILTPFIFASSPLIEFGVCHVKLFTSGFIFLSNPSEVIANWKILHIKSQLIKTKDDKTIDDESVFQFNVCKGLLHGPTISIAAAMSAQPIDHIRR